MAVFRNMLVTNSGKIQYAKAISGSTLTFASVKFGSGKASSDTEAVTLTDLKNAKVTGAIKSIDTTTRAGVAEIKVEISNETLDEQIDITEIGVFCTDPDDGTSVMYAYAYSENDIDVIPSNDYGTVIWKMSVLLTIDNVTTGGGAATPQSSLIDFTPEITPTSADTTVFVSNIIATGKYANKGGLVDAFYEVSGTLTNMESALEKLSSLRLSLPVAATKDASIVANMIVTSSGNQYIVGVEGTINAENDYIDIQYFGEQNGTFKLCLTAQYVG